MKLKNLFGMAAMAALVLSGCSSDEVVENFSPENAIEFGTYVGRDAQGRASEVKIEDLQQENVGFGVYAYYTGASDFVADQSQPNFMNNQHVTFNSTASTWEYTPIKYWPNTEGEKVSFFAYAPFGNTNISAPTKDSENFVGSPVLIFTANSAVADQVDLLYADDMTPDNQKYDYIDMTKQGVNDRIMFNFKHALSRIGFKVQALVDYVNNDNNGDKNDDAENSEPIGNGTTIKVESVELIGNFAQTGFLNLNGGGWNHGTVANTVYSLGTDDFTDVADYKVTTLPQDLNNTDKYMMIIPKDFDGKDASGAEDATDKIQIKVVYKVKTMDANLKDGFIEITNTVTSDPFNFEFVQGKAYTFVLHLGLTSVKFAAQVGGWDVVDDIAVNVPINVETTVTPTTPAPGEG